MTTNNEFKVIPGFSNYKINREGKVIRISDNKEIKIASNTKRYNYYTLTNDNNERKYKNQNYFINLTFLDLSEYREIPNCSKFLVNIKGKVINKESLNEIKPTDKYIEVRLDDNKRKKFYVPRLVKTVFRDKIIEHYKNKGYVLVDSFNNYMMSKEGDFININRLSKPYIYYDLNNKLIVRLNDSDNKPKTRKVSKLIREHFGSCDFE